MMRKKSAFIETRYTYDRKTGELRILSKVNTVVLFKGMKKPVKWPHVRTMTMTMKNITPAIFKEDRDTFLNMNERGLITGIGKILQTGRTNYNGGYRRIESFFFARLGVE